MAGGRYAAMSWVRAGMERQRCVHHGMRECGLYYFWGCDRRAECITRAATAVYRKKSEGREAQDSKHPASCTASGRISAAAAAAAALMVDNGQRPAAAVVAAEATAADGRYGGKLRQPRGCPQRVL